MFWVTATFFGFGCLLSLVRLVIPWDLLRLMPHGYEEHVLSRSSHVAWKDIDHFMRGSGQAGLRQTETWLSLSLVKGLPFQSATRPSSPIPASWAMRSHSAGQM